MDAEHLAELFEPHVLQVIEAEQVAIAWIVERVERRADRGFDLGAVALPDDGQLGRRPPAV